MENFRPCLHGMVGECLECDGKPPKKKGHPLLEGFLIGLLLSIPMIWLTVWALKMAGEWK